MICEEMRERLNYEIDGRRVGVNKGNGTCGRGKGKVGEVSIGKRGKEK